MGNDINQDFSDANQALPSSIEVPNHQVTHQDSAFQTAPQYGAGAAIPPSPIAPYSYIAPQPVFYHVYPAYSGFQLYQQRETAGLAKSIMWLLGTITVCLALLLFGLADTFLYLTDWEYQSLLGDEDSTTQVLIVPLVTVLLLLSYIALWITHANWVGRVRNNLRSRGLDVGTTGYSEWWGWFLPVANIVLGILVAISIARKKVHTGLIIVSYIMLFFLSSALTIMGDLLDEDLDEDGVPRFGAPEYEVWDLFMVVAVVSLLSSFPLIIAVVRGIEKGHREILADIDYVRTQGYGPAASPHPSHPGYTEAHPGYGAIPGPYGAPPAYGAPATFPAVPPGSPVPPPPPGAYGGQQHGAPPPPPR